VGSHRFAAVAEADRLLAEPGLEAHQEDRHDAQPEQRAPFAVVAPGQDRQAQDQDSEDHRNVAVDPFEPGLVIPEGGDELALAQRPVRAAQPGVGRADDHADRDEQEGRRDRHRRQLLKPGHQASAIVVDRGSAATRIGRITGRRARPF
jgi:hypothetical protein